MESDPIRTEPRMKKLGVIYFSVVVSTLYTLVLGGELIKPEFF